MLAAYHAPLPVVFPLKAAFKDGCLVCKTFLPLAREHLIRHIDLCRMCDSDSTRRYHWNHQRRHALATMVLRQDHSIARYIWQRNRVALALVTFHGPHVLLLDEITNHLDMGTVESLVEALCAFERAVVVVSHDMWFLKQVVEGGDDDDDNDGSSQNGEEKGVLYSVTKKGELKRWEKGIDAHVDRIRRLREKNG
ncbi:hypothetical protein BJ165DRAFT_1598736 [Panaeolus papilionaceus]|nr:hypothetical protein BJ165DRAFT_1598736 [Panaeolus papilionaceus]